MSGGICLTGVFRIRFRRRALIGCLLRIGFVRGGAAGTLVKAEFLYRQKTRYGFDKAF